MSEALALFLRPGSDHGGLLGRKTEIMRSLTR